DVRRRLPVGDELAVTTPRKGGRLRGAVPCCPLESRSVESADRRHPVRWRWCASVVLSHKESAAS
ncbi:MAG: hypothetical protein ACJ72A_10475, partial [Nocardioidaceae bacterium]